MTYPWPSGMGYPWTPGPWSSVICHYQDGYLYAGIAAFVPASSRLGGSQHVMSVVMGTDEMRENGEPMSNVVSGRELSNLKLIAAAPALAEALEQLLRTMPEPYSGKPIGAPGSPARAEQDARVGAWRAAKAALAQAKGDRDDVVN